MPCEPLYECTTTEYHMFDLLKYNDILPVCCCACYPSFPSSVSAQCCIHFSFNPISNAHPMPSFLSPLIISISAFPFLFHPLIMLSTSLLYCIMSTTLMSPFFLLLVSRSLLPFVSHITNFGIYPAQK